jgi:hypothetical protein
MIDDAQPRPSLGQSGLTKARRGDGEVETATDNRIAGTGERGRPAHADEKLKLFSLGIE